MIYNDVHASLLNFCKRQIAAQPSVFAGFEVFDFDAHATTNELPSKNLIGIAEYAIDNDEETYTVSGMVIVCTKADDSATVVMNKAIDHLFNVMRPGKGADQFPVLNAETGIQIGALKVKEKVSVMPMAETKGRPLKALAFELGATLLTPPA